LFAYEQNYAKTTITMQLIFKKFGGKVAYEPPKKPLDLGGNLHNFIPARRSKHGTSYGNVGGWVGGWLSVTAGIVSKRLNLS